jgi:hypothetical protein
MRSDTHACRIAERIARDLGARLVLFVAYSVQGAVFLSERAVVLTKSPGCVKATIDLPRIAPSNSSTAAIRRASSFCTISVNYYRPIQFGDFGRWPYRIARRVSALVMSSVGVDYDGAGPISAFTEEEKVRPLDMDGVDHR